MNRRRPPTHRPEPRSGTGPDAAQSGPVAGKRPRGSVSSIRSVSTTLWSRATGRPRRPIALRTAPAGADGDWPNGHPGQGSGPDTGPDTGPEGTPDSRLRLRVATYNIHKGVMNDMRRMRSAPTLTELRQRLGELHADVIFLQEVQGMNKRLATRFEQSWPAEPQGQYLAQAVGRSGPYQFAYGENAKYLHGHHGNALLSQFPILHTENRDFSDNVLEKRGVLHCVLDAPGHRLHCFVVHFGLFGAGRLRQAEALIEWIDEVVQADEPLVIAGDFNDWRDQLSRRFHAALGVRDVLNCARTFPAAAPCLRLDRMYVRGLDVEAAHVMFGRDWARLSDHAPLVADLRSR